MFSKTKFFFQVKTHMQARASSSIAVGYQHNHTSSYQALRDIHLKFGIRGLWRGAAGTVTRSMVGSGVQLSTFTVIRTKIGNLDIFPNGSVLVPISASFVSGILISLCMTPFDVISTRLFNQGVDSSGRGKYYSGLLDCFVKTVRKEGVLGLYKGLAASYLRLGPHTALSLVFWDRLRKLYYGKESSN